MKKTKGILLAGGTGSRLFPITLGTCKQLLPVYDKPMVYYPLSTLMLAGIQDILIITTPKDLDAFQRLLKDGKQWGLNLQYQVQNKPGGLAEALILGEDFLAGSPCSLILGDNLFYGMGLTPLLENAIRQDSGAFIFGYPVTDPKNYGVIEVDKHFKPKSLEEKPTQPKSNYAVPGLYFYDQEAPQIAKSVRPSPRGELEITDVNRIYLEKGLLKCAIFSRGTAWFDTGNPDALLQASNFIQTIELRQGLKIGCPEEIAFRKGWLKSSDLEKLASEIKNTEYSRYLLQIRDELR